jgi:hypothetical protein
MQQEIVNDLGEAQSIASLRESMRYITINIEPNWCSALCKNSMSNISFGVES